jgi:uncharacterized protein (TIGR02246 family)
LRALAGCLFAFSLAVQAGEVTVIRPKPFIAEEDTYYVVLDGQQPLDIDSREHVRFTVPSGRHVLAVRCPKANSRRYAENKVEQDFGAAPAYFVIAPRFDCASIEAVDARTAAGLIGNTSPHPAGRASTYQGGVVVGAAAVVPREVDLAPKDEVAAATAAWVEAFNSRDPARIVALYDPEAVLIGTSAKAPGQGKAAIAQYFKNAPSQPMNRVALGEHRVRVYGDMAVDSGLYNFFQVNEGNATLLPARYTFVYRKRDGKWLIVEHHSSRVP